MSAYVPAPPIPPSAVTSAALQEDVSISATNVFSDMAGTVAATVGGKVAVVRDKSGHIAFNQAIAAAQPTLGLDTATGLYYLQGDGLATFMNRDSKADSGTILAVYALDKTDNANWVAPSGRGQYQGICAVPAVSGIGYEFYALRNPRMGGPVQSDLALFTRARNDTTSTTSYAPPLIGSIDVLMLRTDGRRYELDRDGVPVEQGVAMATVGKVALGGTYSVIMALVSNAGTVKSFLKGRLYSFHTWTGRLSDAEMAGVSQWAKTRIGRGQPTGKWLGAFFYGDGLTDEAGFGKAMVMVQTDDPTDLKYRASASLAYNFNLAANPTDSAMSGRDYGLASDGSDVYVVNTGGAYVGGKTGLFLRKSRADRFNFDLMTFVDTSALGQPVAPEFVKNQNGSIWYDAKHLPALVFHVGTSKNQQIQYIVQPVDTTWKTGGAWGMPTLISGTIPVGSIDSSIVVVNGVFHHFYADWGVTPNVIGYATATSLTGPYTPVGAHDTFGFGSYYESPQPLNIGGSIWMIQVDHNGAGYFYAISTTGISGPYSTLSPVTAPFVPEHGNLIPTPPGW